MYLLRRAAVRTLSLQPTSFIAKQRTFVTRSAFSPRITTQSQFQSLQRRFASDDVSKEEASPAEAETSGETVTTEPTEAEQEETVKEESIATPDVADAATEQSTIGSTAETVRSAVKTVKEKAQDTFERVAPASASFGPGSEGRTERRSEVGSFTAPQPSKILYIGNLYFEATAEQLEEEFRQFGPIINVKIATDPKGLSKGFGYIEFEDVDSAAKAIRGLDQQVFLGRRMAVQYHVRREPRNVTRSMTPTPPSKTLFIGNMSFQMSDKDLNDLFREVRNVLDVRVAIDRRSGQPRGFAHADFIDVASAEKAKKLLETKVIYGRTLRVDYSVSSSPKRGEGSTSD